MQAAVTVTPARIPELLLGLATVRPVFIWGAPGIGKSSLVREFAESLGLECVSLLGTQLAPEDLIGVPQIRDGRSVFCPPEAIARDEPYCLFLDELNAATPDVQKAFYSLILDRRIGNYELPAGSIVIGAGNRATDNALARPDRVRAGQPARARPPGGVRRRTGWSGPGRTASTRGSSTTSSTAPTTCGPSRRRPRSPSPRPAPGTCSPTRCTPSARRSTSTR